MTETNDSGNGLKIRSFLHQNYIDELLQLTPKGKILQNLTESASEAMRTTAKQEAPSSAGGEAFNISRFTLQR